MTTGDKFPNFPLRRLWLIDVHTLFLVGSDALVAPQPPGLCLSPSCISWTSSLTGTHQFLVLFTRPRLWHFPLGDRLRSPCCSWTQLIHQPHWMNSDRECFSPRWAASLLHLKLRKQAPSMGSAFYLSVWPASSLTDVFIVSMPSCLSLGSALHGDISKGLVNLIYALLKTSPGTLLGSSPNWQTAQLSFWNRGSLKLLKNSFVTHTPKHAFGYYYKSQLQRMKLNPLY